MRVVVHGPRFDILSWLVTNVGNVSTDVYRSRVIGEGWTFEPAREERDAEGWAYLVEFDDERWATALVLRWG